LVEKNYRVKADAKNRALAGYQWGGIQTLYVGINNTDLFSCLWSFQLRMDNTYGRVILPKLNYDFMRRNIDKINGNLKLALDWNRRQGRYSL